MGCNTWTTLAGDVGNRGCVHAGLWEISVPSLNFAESL